MPYGNQDFGHVRTRMKKILSDITFLTRVKESDLHLSLYKKTTAQINFCFEWIAIKFAKVFKSFLKK